MSEFYYNIKHCVVDFDQVTLDKQVIFDSDLEECLNTIYSEGYIGQFIRRILDINNLKQFLFECAKLDSCMNAKEFVLDLTIYILKNNDLEKIETYFRDECNFLLKSCNGMNMFNDMNIYCDWISYQRTIFDKYFFEYYNYNDIDEYKDNPKLYIENFIDKLEAMKDGSNLGEIIKIITIINKTDKEIRVGDFTIFQGESYQFGVHGFKKDIIKFESELGNFIYDADRFIPFTLYSNNIVISEGDDNFTYIVSSKHKNPEE